MPVCTSTCCCFLCGLLLFVLFFGLCGFCFCFFVFRFLFVLQSDKGIGLCIGPLPVYFCGPTARPLRELTN